MLVHQRVTNLYRAVMSEIGWVPRGVVAEGALVSVALCCGNSSVVGVSGSSGSCPNYTHYELVEPRSRGFTFPFINNKVSRFIGK